MTQAAFELYDIPDAPYIARAERFGVEDDEETVIGYCDICGAAIMSDDSRYEIFDGIYHCKCYEKHMSARAVLSDMGYSPITGVD